MKIDMLSMIANNSVNNDIKQEKSELEFSSILKSKVDNSCFKDNCEDEIVDENKLLEFMYMLISSLKINDITHDKNVDELNLFKIIENTEKAALTEIQSIFKTDEIDTLLSDINLSNDEINLINNKLKEIIYNHTEKSNENLNEDNLEDNLIVNKKNSTEDTILKFIKKELLNSLNEENTDKNKKDNNYSNIENSFNNNFKQINYVEEKDILLQISDLDDVVVFEKKEVEVINDKVNILNNISSLEGNLNKDIPNIKPVEVRTAYMPEDIVQAVKYIKNNEIEDLTLKINPKELGELTIKLIKNKNENKVVITSSSNETFKLINENLKDIENYLNNLDIKLNQVSIEMKSFVKNDFSGELNQQFSRQSSKEERKHTFNKQNSSEKEVDKVSEDTNINLLV